jgi:hypothetical protein
MFLVFSDHFDVLMSKVFFKNKNYHFNAFLSEKYFEKQPLPQSQILPPTNVDSYMVECRIFFNPLFF